MRRLWAPPPTDRFDSFGRRSGAGDVIERIDTHASLVRWQQVLLVTGHPRREQRSADSLLTHKPTLWTGDPVVYLPVHSDLAEVGAGEHEGDSVLQCLVLDWVWYQAPPRR